MSSRSRKLSAKRVATKTYFEYGVTPIEVHTDAKRNYANFVVGLAIVFGVYLIAQAFGI